MTPHAKLVNQWATTSSGIVAGSVDPSSVKAIERRYDIVLPPEFRQYLLTSCPESDPSWDNDLINWWPIGRIKSISEEYQHKVASREILDRANNFLFFADFSIWCWAWAICCDQSEYRGCVAVIGGGDRFVAQSFAEFVDLYIEDPLSTALSPR